MANGYGSIGAPCDLFREHLGLNLASFSATSLTDADFFRETANIGPMPARTGHVPDATAYATQPVADSWGQRLKWGATPAQVTSGAGQLEQQGQLT
jgi:hypothetical protein